MPAVVSREHLTHNYQLRALLSAYARSEDLIRIGAYSKGADPVLDRAVAVLPELQAFLRQTPQEHARVSRTPSPAECALRLTRDMAFQFTLEAVLRFRQSLEDRERLRLESLLARRAALLHELEQSQAQPDLQLQQRSATRPDRPPHPCRRDSFQCRPASMPSPASRSGCNVNCQELKSAVAEQMVAIPAGAAKSAKCWIRCVTRSGASTGCLQQTARAGPAR